MVLSAYSLSESQVFPGVGRKKPVVSRHSGRDETISVHKEIIGCNIGKCPAAGQKKVSRTFGQFPNPPDIPFNPFRVHFHIGRYLFICAASMPCIDQKLFTAFWQKRFESDVIDYNLRTHHVIYIFYGSELYGLYRTPAPIASPWPMPSCPAGRTQRRP